MFGCRGEDCRSGLWGCLELGDVEGLVLDAGGEVAIVVRVAVAVAVGGEAVDDYGSDVAEVVVVRQGGGGKQAYDSHHHCHAYCFQPSHIER